MCLGRQDLGRKGNILTRYAKADKEDIEEQRALRL